MREIGGPEPLELGIEIGKVPALQQWVVGEIDARRHILRHECDLLCFGKEILRHTVEHEAAYRLYRQDFLGNDLGRIENIEVEIVGEILVEELQTEFPFGE